jgi:hypothetical protein
LTVETTDGSDPNRLDYVLRNDSQLSEGWTRLRYR